MNDYLKEALALTKAQASVRVMNEEEMMRVRNMGKKSLEEVINKLSSLGLSLASEDR